MKTFKLLGTCLMIALFSLSVLFSCQNDDTEALEKTSLNSSAMERARALDQLGDLEATDERVKNYRNMFNNLSYEELNAFYELRYERALAEAVTNDDMAEQETIEQWHEKRIKYNELAMETFNVPSNQLTDEQAGELYNSLNEEGANERVAIRNVPATCAFATFPFNSAATQFSGPDFKTSTNVLFVQQGDQDCDCQIAFPFTNTSFRHLFPTSTRMANLITNPPTFLPFTNIVIGGGFNNSLGRRNVASGVSAGTYILYGAGRSGLAGYNSCQELANEVLLSRICNTCN